MHYGIEVVPFGGFADPRAVVALAVAAEAAGWEGIALWDHVNFPYGAGDPWIMLAAVAASTQRLKLVTGVAPMPRYQPHLLARTLAALDLLSQGRVIFGTGLGVEWDFAPFGEPGDDRTRAAMADEGLEVLASLLSGAETTHHGRFYTVEAVRLATLPLQQPRIPCWIGGASKAGLRRAAQWDGWIMGTIDEAGAVTNPPEKIAADVAYILAHRTATTPFAVAVDGITRPGERGLVREYAAAGATWWFEAIYQTRADHDTLLQRIAAGPPA